MVKMPMPRAAVCNRQSLVVALRGRVARLSCGTHSWWMAGMRYAGCDYSGVATIGQPLRILGCETTARRLR